MGKHLMMAAEKYHHDKNDSEMLWFYFSMGSGFVVGFGGVCVTLRDQIDNYHVFHIIKYYFLRGEIGMDGINSPNGNHLWSRPTTSSKSIGLCDKMVFRSRSSFNIPSQTIDAYRLQYLQNMFDRGDLEVKSKIAGVVPS